MYSIKLQNIKKKLAFTLVELIIVIAIISLLAAVTVVAINPNSMFINARNTTRSNDLLTLQAAIVRYVADNPVSGTQRNINDLSGYSLLYANAVNGVGGKCSNGINGVNTSIEGAMDIDTTVSNTTIDITPLINNNYLPKLIKDPKGTNYKACIDTVNGNQLVVYADGTENKAVYATNAIGKYSGNIDLTNGLVGYWKMDESSVGNAIDSSGNNNTGTSIGTTVTTGTFANGRSFNGTTDYISVPSASSLQANSTGQTLSAWVNPNPNSAFHDIVAKNSGPANASRGYILRLTNANRWDYELYYGVSICSAVGTSTAVSGQWYNVAGRYDGSTISIWVNGVKETSNACSITPNTPAANVTIGTFDTVGDGEAWNSKIDEARIYNRALSDTEVNALYNYAPGPVAYYNFENGSNTNLPDVSGNYNGTWSGTSTTRYISGKYGTGGTFVRNNTDYINVGNVNIMGPITVCSWLNITVRDTTGWNIIFSKWNGWSDPMQYVLYYDGYWDHFDFAIGNNTTGGYDSATTEGNLAGIPQGFVAGKWEYFCGTFNGTAISLYRNGVLMNTQTLLGTQPTNSYNSNIGNRNTLDMNMNGALDEIRVYNYARTQSQLLADMN